MCALSGYLTASILTGHFLSRGTWGSSCPFAVTEMPPVHHWSWRSIFRWEEVHNTKTKLGRYFRNKMANNIHEINQMRQDWVDRSSSECIQPIKKYCSHIRVAQKLCVLPALWLNDQNNPFNAATRLLLSSGTCYCCYSTILQSLKVSTGTALWCSIERWITLMRMEINPN